MVISLETMWNYVLKNEKWLIKNSFNLISNRYDEKKTIAVVLLYQLGSLGINED